MCFRNCAPRRRPRIGLSLPRSRRRPMSSLLHGVEKRLLRDGYANGRGGLKRLHLRNQVAFDLAAGAGGIDQRTRRRCFGAEARPSRAAFALNVDVTMPDEQLTAAPPSPCVGVCRVGESTGYRVGCARTRAEIASWRTASAKTISQIWAELPVRRAASAPANWSKSSRVKAAWSPRRRERRSAFTFQTVSARSPSQTTASSYWLFRAKMPFLSRIQGSPHLAPISRPLG